MEEKGNCFFCGVETNERCENCRWAFYCAQHKPLHTDSEGKCLPYKVERVNGVGNCLVAGRDISPGEIVLLDAAATVSPSTSHLVCVECISPISPTSRCSRCNLPVCCSGPYHQMECDVMAEQLEDNDEKNCATSAGGLSSSLYLAVSVIRLLSLKKSEPDRWNLVQLLMDHLEQRRKQPKWNKMIQDVQNNIPRQSPADIERMVGILLTNSVSCRPVHGEERGQALFPVFSLTSHSCVANTWRCIEDDCLTLRTTVPVSRGSELTTSYKSPAIGSISRRPHFPSTWFFDCRCPRCSSPTELDTYMSALRCPTCPGVLLPIHPLDYNSAWACSDCSRSMAGPEAVETTVMLHKMITEAGGSVSDLERVTNHLETVVHPQHYLLLQVKRDLARLYGNAEGYALRDISTEQLEKKMSFSEQNLAVMEVVEPGYSRWRGRMLEELAMAKLEGIRRKAEEGSLEKFEAMLEYRGAIKLIKQSAKCRQFETKEEQNQFAERVKNLLMN